MKKVRADVLLAKKGLAPSRSRAQALILAGKVFVAERRVEKSGETLDPESPIEVRARDHPYVSRGGVKLQGAFESFGLDPHGMRVVDFGASTGGFTDCLLQHGAASVYCVDVGYGQLHDKLRRDSRVTNMERTNARHLRRSDFAEPIDLLVIDASFIGLEKLLPAASDILQTGADLVALVKPQFQVGQREVGKGGVVRDPELRRRAIEDAIRDAIRFGFDLVAEADSPITGPKGNQETFIWMRRSERQAPES